MRHTRRSVLAALVGTAVAGGGCVGGTDDSATGATTTSPADRTTTEPTTTAPTTASYDASVSRTAVTPGLVARNSPDSITVYGSRGEQYVLAEVTVQGDRPPGDAFALHTDAGAFPATTEFGGYGPELYGRGRRYGDEATGWLAVVPPKPVETDRAALTWPGGEFQLPDGAVRRLARPPTTFETRSLEAPDSVAADADVTLSVTVANTGSADGTWVAALNRSGPSVAVIPETTASLQVPAGETREWTYTNTAADRYGDGDRMELRLVTRNGDTTRTVTVRS